MQRITINRLPSGLGGGRYACALAILVAMLTAAPAGAAKSAQAALAPKPQQTCVPDHAADPACASPSDQDGDGVADAVDDCPRTPKGALVDAKGCAVDDDLDGVANGIDVCPGTAAGEAVDAKGCADGQVPSSAGRMVSSSSPVLTATPPVPVPVAVPIATAPHEAATTPAAPVLAPAPAAAPSPPPAPSPAPVVDSPRPVPDQPVATIAAAAPFAPPAQNTTPPVPAVTKPAVEPPRPPVMVAPTPPAAAPAVVPHQAVAVPVARALLSLPFAAQSTVISEAAMRKAINALPALRKALAEHPRFSLLVEGYADKASDGAIADTVARSRANRLRRLLEDKGLDQSRIRSVGHLASASGEALRRADVRLDPD